MSSERAFLGLFDFTTAEIFQELARVVRPSGTVYTAELVLADSASVGAPATLIVFNLSGHGHFDMMAYAACHHGQLEDHEYPFEAVEEAMAHLSQLPPMGFLG